MSGSKARRRRRRRRERAARIAIAATEGARRLPVPIPRSKRITLPCTLPAPVASGSLARIVRWRSLGSNTSAPSAVTPRSPGRGSAPGCGAWNTLEKRAAPPKKPAGRSRSRSAGGRRHARRRSGRSRPSARPACMSGIAEFDRVLGGGMVPGSLVLLGGAPGIGKSTLASMALANVHAVRRADALRLGRGVGGPDPHPRPAARRRGARRAGDRRELARRRARHGRGRAARPSA